MVAAGENEVADAFDAERHLVLSVQVGDEAQIDARNDVHGAIWTIDGDVLVVKVCE